MSLTVNQAKSIAKFVVGWSTTVVIDDVIKNNVAPQTKIQKVEVLVAAFVVARLISMNAEKYAANTVDMAVETWNKAKEKTQQQNKS
jgi:hypothetical protein